MASYVWGRDPNEAYQNPYEYGIQEQFLREASTILDKLLIVLMDERYTVIDDDTSLRKALIMLHIDSVDSLRDGIDLMSQKKHRIASRVLRDVFENISLCNYFYFDNSKTCAKDLKKWFENHPVSHRVYRESLHKRDGSNKKDRAKKYYQQLSNITHRTYGTLKYGYSLGANNKLVYESKYDGGIFVSPSTASMYLAIFANMIDLTLNEIVINEIIEMETIKGIQNEAFEPIGVQRKSEGIITNGYIDKVYMD